jgi:hypothetical protein
MAKIPPASKLGYSVPMEGSVLHGFYDKTGLTFPIPIQDDGKLGTDDVIYTSFEGLLLNTVKTIGKKNIKKFVHDIYTDINKFGQITDHKLTQIGENYGFLSHITVNMVVVSLVFYLTITKQIPNNNEYGTMFVNHNKLEQPHTRFNAVIRKLMELEC